MKYIDAEKLLAEIERLRKLLPWGGSASQLAMECNCKNEAYDEILAFIDSLQDEQAGLTNPLFEECLAHVDPDVRRVVRNNMDKVMQGKIEGTSSKFPMIPQGEPTDEELFKEFGTTSEEYVKKAMKLVEEKIAKTKNDGSWKGVDVDKFMEDMRGEEPKCKDSLHIEETCKENEDSFTHSLEEAANEYGKREYNHAIHFWDEGMSKHKPEVLKSDFVDSFIAGAKWQREQMMELRQIKKKKQES